MKFQLQLLATVILMSTSSCAILFGNVKPVTERSDHYEVNKLDHGESNWKRIGFEDENQDQDRDHSDLAFQSQKTSSIISINSACRSRIRNQSKDLRDFTNLLLLGVSDISKREEKIYTLSEVPALETTLEGNMNRQKTKIRTVVLRKSACLYDLMYVAQPENFDKEIGDFEKFVSSLRLQ